MAYGYFCECSPGYLGMCCLELKQLHNYDLTFAVDEVRQAISVIEITASSN